MRKLRLGMAIMAIALALTMTAATGLAESHSETIETNIIFNGQTFVNTTNVTWDVEYPVPEGGVQWDGSSTYVYVTYPNKDDIKESPSGMEYIDRQLIFFAKQGDSIGEEFESVKQMLAKYSFRIIGYIAVTGCYQAECVEPVDYDTLIELKNNISHEPIIQQVTVNLSYIEDIQTNAIKPFHDNYAGRTSNSSLWNGDTLDDRSPDGKNWGMEFIQAPSAWKYDNITYPVNGVVWDSGYYDHSDIDIIPLIVPSVPTTVPDRDFDNDHGTHVAGIFAAKHDSIGVSGVAHNIQLYGIANKSDFREFHIDEDMRENLQTFGFAELACMATSIMQPKDSKTTPVIINHSMGYAFKTSLLYSKEENSRIQQYKDFILALQNNSEDLQTKWREHNDDHNAKVSIYVQQMERLIHWGYENFLIIQTAGNDFLTGIDAIYGYVLSQLTGTLEDHVIVVGSIGWNGAPQHAASSQVGNRVDILAPGVDIWSTVGKNEYAYLNGTSMAAPHVAGAAAFVWSICPDFSAADVKRIVTTTTRYIEKREDDGRRRADNPYPLLNVLAAVELAREEATPATINVTIQEAGVSPRLPVKDAEVILYYEGVNHILDQKTNADGTVSTTVKPGTYTVIFEHPGYLDSEKTVTVRSGETIDVVLLTAKENSDPTPTPSGSNKTALRISVIDDYVIPVKDAEIILYYDGVYHILDQKTNSEGMLSVTVDPGTYTVIFEQPGYLRCEKTVTVREGEVIDVVLDTYTLHPATTAPAEPTSTPTSAPTEKLACYVKITQDPEYLGMLFNLQLRNVQGTVTQFDVRLLNKGITIVDTMDGIYEQHGLAHTDDSWSFYVDDELLQGAVLYVTASDSSGQTFNGNMITVAGNEHEGWMPTDD